MSANALILKILILTDYGLDGFSYAAEGNTGNALGARDLDSFHAAVLRCAWWSGALALAWSMFVLRENSALDQVLTDIPAVRHYMLQHTGWLVALPLIAAAS